MGITWSSYARYRDSKQKRNDWLRSARVRSGRVYFELDGGYAMGETDCAYSQRVRVSYDEAAQDGAGGFTNDATSTWLGRGSGDGATFKFAVGFVPAYYLDTSVAIGVQTGQKYMDTGWECVPEEGELGCDASDVAAGEYPSSVTSYPAVGATRLLVEPKLRATPVDTGVVKPYALVAFTLEAYDGFHVPDEGKSVDFGDVEGGADYGVTAGLGLAIDPVSPVTIFLEVPYTYWLSPGTQESISDDVNLLPSTLDQDLYGPGTLRVVAGLGVRL